MIPHPLLGNGYVIDPSSGQLLSQKQMRIAEIINDYNPRMELVWVPPSSRTAADVYPFAVVLHRVDGIDEIVCNLREDEVDDRVIATIYANDLAKTNKNEIWSRLEAADRARELVAAKEWEDRKAEARELATAVLKSPKSSYTADINGKQVKFE